MTKYILNSGGYRNHPDRAAKFFAEIVKGLGDKPKILVCHFAQPRQEWEKNFENDKQKRFSAFPEGVNPQFELAYPKTFAEQIQNADIIYMHGGDDPLIIHWLRTFDLPKIWEGKVVVGSSASSHALSKQFWTCDWREPMDGLGIVPIKFLAHYKSTYGNDDPRGPIDWDKAYEELKNYGDQSLPIYALEEGEFAVFEK